MSTITTPTLSSTHFFPPPYQSQKPNAFFFNPTSPFTPAPPPTSIKASTFTPTSTTTTTPDPNIQIHHYINLNNLKDAIFTLTHTPKSKIHPTTYLSLLQLCAKNKSLQHGKTLHSFIISSNITLDNALASKLVYMYLNCNDLAQARKLFDEYTCKDRVFMWNFIISEYAKIGNYIESVNLYKEMRERGVEPDFYTFSCVLKCCGVLGRAREGEVVHGCVLKLGFGGYNTVGNSLIGFYSKCGKMENARRVFDEMSDSDRDVISWNSVIGGYVGNGRVEKAVELFGLMRVEGVEGDVVTMVSVLPACAEVGNLLFGRAIHGYVIKSDGFVKEITVNNTLLDMYAKCGDLDSAVLVFERMDRKTVVSWTSMLSGYARQGQCDRAIELFWRMQEAGVEPDLYTVTSVLHVCACNQSLDNGKDIHDFVVKNGLLSNLSVANALMDMYAKCGSMDDAQLVFDQMLGRDMISWNTMIGGYSKSSLPDEAFRMFSAMQLEYKPNFVTFACILPACASVSALDRGREIHGYVLRSGFSSDRCVMNALVDMYAKCGAMLLARLLFDMMPTKDLVSWTAMIAGYGMHGHGREAITIFNEMRSSGIEPDEISFVALLYACSHSGLVDEGWRLFHIMKHDCKIEPKLEHYACIVDLFSRAGRLTKALNFIEAMPIRPDSTIWGALLCGCRIHRDVNLAEKVAEKVFELEPENTGYYVLLANIYAEAEKWEEVKKLRERMGRRGLRKSPGCSWIETKSKVQIFFAGDKSHPQIKEIESLLGKVRIRMKEDGVLPNHRYALVLSGDAEKEEALCGHSEKLAMAYGILTMPYGKTIRVMKNLRVCGDCHEMAKFMSKLFTKEIILRDANRFHQFKDGRCSCRGYW